MIIGAFIHICIKADTLFFAVEALFDKALVYAVQDDAFKVIIGAFFDTDFLIVLSAAIAVDSYVADKITAAFVKLDSFYI